MEGVQLRDEAAQDRVRAAIEFLDPSKYHRNTGLFWSFELTFWFFYLGDARARRSVNRNENEM
jgi:hypothetical protein